MSIEKLIADADQRFEEKLRAYSQQGVLPVINNSERTTTLRQVISSNPILQGDQHLLEMINDIERSSHADTLGRDGRDGDAVLRALLAAYLKQLIREALGHAEIGYRKICIERIYHWHRDKIRQLVALRIKSPATTTSPTHPAPRSVAFAQPTAADVQLIPTEHDDDTSNAAAAAASSSTDPNALTDDPHARVSPTSAAPGGPSPPSPTQFPTRESVHIAPPPSVMIGGTFAAGAMATSPAMRAGAAVALNGASAEAAAEREVRLHNAVSVHSKRDVFASGTQYGTLRASTAPAAAAVRAATAAAAASVGMGFSGETGGVGGGSVPGGANGSVVGDSVGALGSRAGGTVSGDGGTAVESGGGAGSVSGAAGIAGDRASTAGSPLAGVSSVVAGANAAAAAAASATAASAAALVSPGISFADFASTHSAAAAATTAAAAPTALTQSIVPVQPEWSSANPIAAATPQSGCRPAVYEHIKASGVQPIPTALVVEAGEANGSPLGGTGGGGGMWGARRSMATRRHPAERDAKESKRAAAVALLYGDTSSPFRARTAGPGGASGSAGGLGRVGTAGTSGGARGGGGLNGFVGSTASGDFAMSRDGGGGGGEGAGASGTWADGSPINPAVGAAVAAAEAAAAEASTAAPTQPPLLAHTSTVETSHRKAEGAAIATLEVAQRAAAAGIAVVESGRPTAQSAADRAFVAALTRSHTRWVASRLEELSDDLDALQRQDAAALYAHSSARLESELMRRLESVTVASLARERCHPQLTLEAQSATQQSAFKPPPGSGGGRKDRSAGEGGEGEDDGGEDEAALLPGADAAANLPGSLAGAARSVLSTSLHAGPPTLPSPPSPPTDSGSGRPSSPGGASDRFPTKGRVVVEGSAALPAPLGSLSPYDACPYVRRGDHRRPAPLPVPLTPDDVIAAAKLRAGVARTSPALAVLRSRGSAVNPKRVVGGVSLAERVDLSAGLATVVAPTVRDVSGVIRPLQPPKEKEKRSKDDRARKNEAVEPGDPALIDRLFPTIPVENATPSIQRNEELEMVHQLREVFASKGRNVPLKALTGGLLSPMDRSYVECVARLPKPLAKPQLVKPRAKAKRTQTAPKRPGTRDATSKEAAAVSAAEAAW